MEQHELRELEHRCIQEEAAWCVAACPLHVDARALAGFAAQGDWAAARKALERTMPFPDLLGRICDHPCEAACKRGEAGEPIAVGALERACVAAVGQQTKPLPLPARGTKALVHGAGLAGLTAAWDLARKGHAVTLHTSQSRPGATLLARYAEGLAEDTVETILASVATLLQKAGVVVRTGQTVPDADLEGEAVVFVDLDEPGVHGGALDLTTRDPLTLRLGEGRVFAGGAGASVIGRAAEGRRAATSMDRALQNVSLTLRREKEGPYETRLYTSLQGVEPLPRVPMADAGYSPEEATREAARCLQCECLECVKGCVYLEHYKSYPKAYARRIYNNESIVKGHHQANTMINSCMLCGQCTAICPNDFSMAELCLTTRESMVSRGKMPPSAHDFALEDLAFNRSDHFALVRNSPGETASEWLFFPGCQLAGSSPAQTAAVYRWLLNKLPRTGLALGCCGAPALWSGRRELFAEVLDEVRAAWEQTGRPTLVLACATCLDVFRTHAEDLPVTNLWSVLEETGLPEARATHVGPLTLHDPCSARNHGDLLDAARRLFARLGVELVEPDYTRETTPCCGYGGLLYNADSALAREVAERRVAASVHDLAAYCAMCRDNLAAGGGRALHLLDLLFPEASPEVTRADPAARPSPDFSQRHEHRARLKAELLVEIWGESPPEAAAHEAVRLELTPEIRSLLDERRILLEDVHKVLAYATRTGRRFVDPATGRSLAYHQPVRVTYWVEYEELEDGYRVHNAYSHRMNVPGARV